MVKLGATVISALCYLLATAYVFMLSFGILHSYLHDVPSFSFLESFALITAIRLILISVRDRE